MKPDTGDTMTKSVEDGLTVAVLALLMTAIMLGGAIVALVRGL